MDAVGLVKELQVAGAMICLKFTVNRLGPGGGYWEEVGQNCNSVV